MHTMDRIYHDRMMTTSGGNLSIRVEKGNLTRGDIVRVHPDGMIVSWPRAISTARVDATPWTFADVLPTFAEVARVSLSSVPRVRTNGVSIRGLLQDKPKWMPERTLYWEFGKQAGDRNSGIVGEVYQAARRGRLKAVRYGKEAVTELCDLDKDPAEQDELSDRYPEVYDEYVQLFETHRN